jgi:hypothetical protein
VRRLLFRVAFITVLGCGPALAQIPASPTTLFIPSPAGVAFSAGKWIYDQLTAETVYYIQVTGDGRTPDDARNNGFRLAVEQAIGSVIASETEGRNGRLARDEIINYSGGYVDRYKILKQEPSDYGQRITMEVWIRRSSLPERLLGRSEAAGFVDGNRASVQLDTLNYERRQADRLVDSVLADFPRRAFVIDLKKTEITYNNRQGYLEVPFTLKLDPNYTASLNSALKSVSHGNTGGTYKVSVGKSVSAFEDRAQFGQIIERMISSRPAVRITVLTVENRPIYQACHRWSELDHLDGYQVRPGHFVGVHSMVPFISINGALKLDAIAQLPVNPAFLAQANRVDAEVVLGASCQN